MKLLSAKVRVKYTLAVFSSNQPWRKYLITPRAFDDKAGFP
jgi:hypothetical protein